MPDNIRITHCVYFSWYLPKKTLLRRSCNFNRMTIIKKREKYIPIPLKFSELLKEKSEKWNQGTIEFTVAHDLENETWSIAIVHPRDSFNKKIGYKITHTACVIFLKKKVYSTFVIGWPQQTSCPKPFSRTLTLLAQISQR